MTTNRINLIISLALIACIFVLGALNALLWWFNKAFDPQITMAIVTLVGMLQAYRHTADISAGNGSSGIVPSIPPAPK